MATPGEVMQAIGQAYQYVFVGALEASIRPFQNRFHVHTNPEKTTFKGRGGNSYSFDFNGEYYHPWLHTEVFGECKGYSKGANLLEEFRCFVAKAYVASVDYERNRQDLFWFVTNVPFACSEGSGVRNYDFVFSTLRDKKSPQLIDILGGGHVDERAVRSLVARGTIGSFYPHGQLSQKYRHFIQGWRRRVIVDHSEKAACGPIPSWIWFTC